MTTATTTRDERALAGEVPSDFHGVRAAWWRREAAQCRAVGMADWAQRCETEAAVWDRATVVGWGE